MECYQCLRHGDRGTYSGIHWYCLKCFYRYIVRIPNMAEDTPNPDIEFIKYLVNPDGLGLQLTTEVREAINGHLERRGG